MFPNYCSAPEKIVSPLRLISVALLWLSCHGSLAFAQPTNRDKPKGLPKPSALTLTTRDGVQLRCNYYPGGVIEEVNEKGEKEYRKKTGKEVVPIILVHGWGGRRNEFSFLAGLLQRKGHAVIIPDLRGHGQSVRVRLPNGLEMKIDPRRMRPADMQKFVLDVEAVKKFLLDKNNEAELNIELLVVLGADMGSIVALNWAAADWNRRQLPSFKQGQDVKALILLSPENAFKGLTPNAALGHPVITGKLSVMIVSGKADRKGYSEARSIFKRFDRMRREPASPEDKDLFFFDPETSLRGTRLVDPKARLNVINLIDGFIDHRIVGNAAYFPWRERTNPLEQTE